VNDVLLFKTDNPEPMNTMQLHERCLKWLQLSEKAKIFSDKYGEKSLNTTVRLAKNFYSRGEKKYAAIACYCMVRYDRLLLRIAPKEIIDIS